jgi:transcriptional regulator of heat shock response
LADACACTSLCFAEPRGALAVQGHAHLLGDVHDLEDVRRIKGLFDLMDTGKIFAHIYDRFINPLAPMQAHLVCDERAGDLDLAGFALVVVPYAGAGARGFVSVVGPLHMDYRRIIPIIETMALWQTSAPTPDTAKDAYYGHGHALGPGPE